MTKSIYEAPMEKFYDQMQNRKKFYTPHSFFTPFMSIGEFAITLVGPIALPLISAALSALNFIYALFRSLAAVTYLLGAALSAPSSRDFAMHRLETSASHVLYAAVELALGVVSAVLIPVSFILFLARIATRTGATIANAMGCLPEEQQEPILCNLSGSKA